MPEETKNVSLIIGKAIAGGILGGLAGYCIGVGGSVYAGYKEASLGGGPAAGGIGALFGLAVGVFLVGPAAGAVGLYGGGVTAARNDSVDATFDYIVKTWNAITSENLFKTTSNTNTLGWRIASGITAGIVSGFASYVGAIGASFIAGFNQTKGPGMVGFTRGLLGGAIGAILGAFIVAPAAATLSFFLAGFSTYKNGWEGFKKYHSQIWGLISGKAPEVTKSTPKGVEKGQSSPAQTLQQLQASRQSASPNAIELDSHSSPKPKASTPKVSSQTFINGTTKTPEPEHSWRDVFKSKRK